MKLLLFLSCSFLIAESQILLQTDIYSYQPLPPTLITTRTQHWLTFQVKALDNAIIAFQTYYRHNGTDISYEVILGKGDDTTSDIRQNAYASPEDTYHGSVLNPSEYRPFWVSWEDGILSAGKGNEKGIHEMVSLVLPNLVVHYLSVTGWDKPVDWIIDNTICDAQLGFGLISPKAYHRPVDQALTRDQTETSRIECAVACYNLTWCRGFSYGRANNNCKMFLHANEWETWSVSL